MSTTGMADHLVNEPLYLSDPDGLGIEIYADRPRTTWQYGDQVRSLRGAGSRFYETERGVRVADPQYTFVPANSQRRTK